jgi:hypothetical protein
MDVIILFLKIIIIFFIKIYRYYIYMDISTEYLIEYYNISDSIKELLINNNINE